MTASLIGYSALAALAVAIGALVFPLARIPVGAAPRLGHRGNRRQEALGKGGSFGLIEPAMRVVASWVSRLQLKKYREQIEILLLQAGDYLGITADEFIALSALSALFFAAWGGLFSWLLDSGLVFMIVGLLLGAALPYLQVQGETRRRFKEINRGLPAAIDLAALCMGAGLDFPGALKLIANNDSCGRDVVSREFARILQELEVGHTRRQALRSFEQRAGTEAVRDFVGAVVQAEEKGNPLAEVLQVQAQVLRMHRSVAAEEAAAKAGVMMMVPLFLLLCCILLTMFGPFIINGIGF